VELPPTTICFDYIWRQALIHHFAARTMSERS
jgi:hypothetical protein